MMFEGSNEKSMNRFNCNGLEVVLVAEKDMYNAAMPG
jgi:hypothetical protein